MPYVAVLATGKLPRLLLGQWSMLARLRDIPDTVAEFTGFSLQWDLIAGNFGFHSAEYFKAAPEDQAVPKVDLAMGARTHQ